MSIDRRLLVPFYAAAMGLALAACSERGATDPTPGAALTSLPRDLTTAERSVLGAANAFSFAVWNETNKAQRDSSVFMSPLSVSFSLGMTLNGAANQTFDEMRAGLQFGNASLDDINAGYKSLIALLTSLDRSVTMQIANSIWYRNDFSFNQTFLDAGKTYFDATINPLNFNDANGSLSTINGWVNTKTNGKIPTILKEIKKDDVMFLINAIYFKGSWRAKFDPAQTQDAPFHAVGGDQTARLMHRKDKMSYAETNTYQAVDLPYGDSAFTMTVVLPRAGTSVETVAASLNAQSWQTLTSSFHIAEVDLYLPKVTMSWTREMIPDLRGLGMRVPFVPDGADFTRMSTLGNHLYISLVRHKTFVDINEEGTEAAAVTATGASVTSAPLVELVRVDRPFVFVIRERLTGTVLFMGKVVRLE